MKKYLILILAAMLMTSGPLRAGEADSVRCRVPARAIVASAGSAVVTNAVLTELLKGTIHERRPDGVGRHSWPSRHTSWAFTAASVLSHELYRYSPWWVTGAHAAADIVAWQRIVSGRHYPKDVLGGVAVGLVSAEVGYLIGRVMFPGSYPALPAAPADWLPGLAVTTAALFPLSGPDNMVSARTGFMSAVRLTVPLSEWGGVCVQTDLRSLPLYDGARGYFDRADGWGMSAGMALSRACDGRWAPTGHIMLGAVRNYHMRSVRHPQWSFALDAAVGGMYSLTPRLMIGGEAGYQCWNLSTTVHSITLGLVTRANF